MDQPQCSSCRAYQMTWEPEKPHACRAFGFKSAALPSRVVEESSGSPCSYFEPKPKPPVTRSEAPLW